MSGFVRPAQFGLGLLAAVVVLTACAEPSESPSLAPSVTSTETASSTPQTVLTPAPTPETSDVEVAAFSTAGGILTVRLHNPNTHVGLHRARYEIAGLAADGSISSVVGAGGVPGALCCTIFQLPPVGDFVTTHILNPSRPAITAVEVTVTDPWTSWEGVTAPQVTVTEAAVRAEFGFVFLTGRLSVDQDGPFNAWVGAMVDAGGQLVGISDAVACVGGGSARAFELQGLAQVEGSVTLSEVWSYVTTIPGVGPTPGPINC